MNNCCLELNRLAPSALALLVLACLLSFIGCRNTPNQSNNSANSDSVASTPPFATKEPERYQATRTTTFTEAVTAPNPVNETRTTNVLIMRDGEKRREEHEGGPAGSIVYLELAQGRFVLLTREKLYADLSSEAGNPGLSNPETGDDEVSPDLLLNESVPSSRYQNLGAETVTGRPTTKYLVTSEAGTVANSKSETLIWIDEALGMPIKSESTYTDSNRTTKILMELKNVRIDVDAHSFSLPGDYRKVVASVIFEKIQQAANQTGPPSEKK